jgi:Tyrosine phosphatase family
VNSESSSPRWIALDGAVNARRVVPGVLLRADNLQSLTRPDVRLLIEEEALKVVLDHRTDVEVELEGPGPISTEPAVGIEHRSLYPDTDRKIDDAATVKPWGGPVERRDDRRSRLPANQRNHRGRATSRNRRLRLRRTHTTGRTALTKRRRPSAAEPSCSPIAGLLTAVSR